MMENENSPTVREQRKIEQLVCDEKRKCTDKDLQRRHHIEYALKCLNGLSSKYSGMDASRTWFCYWGLHSLQLLRHRMEKCLLNRIVSFINSCRAEDGGYGGGPGQNSHLGSTYASIMSLIIIGTDEALSSINRKSLTDFISSMRQANGSFANCKEGEIDVRAVYCALSIANICALPDQEKLFEDTAAWLTRCQTYEGGFGGEPDCEAHSGYTFCALASLALLRKVHLVNTDSALKWLVNRQMPSEGGFQGRPNKLVDACYSYWNTACFPALECDQAHPKAFHALFDTLALKSYVLEACQAHTGGFRDKPGKEPDLYHTCYALSGLSVCQLYSEEILGGGQNALESIHPIYNVSVDAVANAQRYFDS